MKNDPTKDPRIAAAVDLIGRTGADQFQFRYSDDDEPVIWMAIGKWDDVYEVGSSTSPIQAIFRLLDQVIDGGTCQHCGKPSGFDEGFEAMPLDDMVCWYQYDPELKKFRRGCEGGDAR